MSCRHSERNSDWCQTALRRRFFSAVRVQKVWISRTKTTSLLGAQANFGWNFYSSHAFVSLRCSVRLPPSWFCFLFPVAPLWQAITHRNKQKHFPLWLVFAPADLTVFRKFSSAEKVWNALCLSCLAVCNSFPPDGVLQLLFFCSVHSRQFMSSLVWSQHFY